MEMRSLIKSEPGFYLEEQSVWDCSASMLTPLTAQTALSKSEKMWAKRNSVPRHTFKGCGEHRRKLIRRVLNFRCRFQLQEKKTNQKTKTSIFRPQPCSDDILFPFLPLAHFLSLLPLCAPSPTPPQSLLDWWSKHRKRAGSVPPHQSRGWAFLQLLCWGQKFTVVFISPFLSQSQSHADAYELWPRQRIPLRRRSDARFTTAPSPTSRFHSLLLLFLFQLDSFVHCQNIGKKNSRNKVVIGNRG